MMATRFNLGDNGDDSPILSRASELTLKLYRSEGTVRGYFKIAGTIGKADDDDVFGGPASADDLRFVSELIERFKRGAGNST